jgi:glycosyltransferase involved in cell wall biosynthesis
MSKLELGRTSRYEGWLVDQFDRTLVTSATDKQALEELVSSDNGARASQREHVHVLPNGVDLDYFTPSSEARRPATLVLTGKMSYHANITAAQHLVEEIMPLVWAKRADVDVWIVGKDPTRAVLDLQKEAGPGAGKVQIIGTVPDMRSYLHQATLAVAPVLYGAGVQNKVLEAMACGTPVIASQQAVSALQTKEGEEVMVGRTPQEFAGAILSLLESPAQQSRLSRAGRAYVEQHHAWSASVSRLEAIYAATRN